MNEESEPVGSIQNSIIMNAHFTRDLEIGQQNLEDPRHTFLNNLMISFDNKTLFELKQAEASVEDIFR